MGSTGCYLLHAYCDGQPCADDPLGPNMIEETGDGVREAKRNLRKAGWLLSKRIPVRGPEYGTEPGALCPRCQGKEAPMGSKSEGMEVRGYEVVEWPEPHEVRGPDWSLAGRVDALSPEQRAEILEGGEG